MLPLAVTVAFGLQLYAGSPSQLYIAPSCRCMLIPLVAACSVHLELHELGTRSETAHCICSYMPLASGTKCSWSLGLHAQVIWSYMRMASELHVHGIRNYMPVVVGTR